MKYFNPFLFSLVFILIGCQSEPEVEPSINGSKKIKELNYSIYAEYSSQFIYSPNERLTKRITKSWSDDPNNYSIETTEYEYNLSNQVSTIRFSPTSYINLEYDTDGNIIKSDSYDNGILRISHKYIYSKDKLQEIQIGDGEFTIKFMYDIAGNLSTKRYYYQGTETSRQTYLAYDNKPNPFKGNQLVFDMQGFDLEYIDYFSNNNPLKYEVTYITYSPLRYNYKC